MQKRLFGEYLLDGKRVSPDQLQRALELQNLQPLGTSVPVGTVLFQLGAIEQEDIASALERQQNDLMGTDSTAGRLPFKKGCRGRWFLAAFLF